MGYLTFKNKTFLVYSQKRDPISIVSIAKLSHKDQTHVPGAIAIVVLFLTTDIV